MFEHSSTSLTLWFHAMYLMTSTRNGVAAKELQRQLGVTYKCAWRIGHQLRELMAARDKATTPPQLSGHVEIDETYVGGYRRKKHPTDRPTAGKTPVWGLVERGGALKGHVLTDAKKPTLLTHIFKDVAFGATISTDTLPAYKLLKHHGYNHRQKPLPPCRFPATAPALPSSFSSKSEQFSSLPSANITARFLA